MKIVHYIPSIDRESGGVGSYMQLLAKPLGKIVELHVVTHQSREMLEIVNAQIHTIPSFSLLEGGRSFKREWLLMLKRIDPDIIQINGCWLPGCAYAGLWAKQVGYKVLLCPHGMLEPWDIKKNYWTRKFPALLLYQIKAIKKADGLLATSEAEKNNLLKLGYNRNVCVIPNGIAISEVEIKKSWEIKRKILFLSLLRKNKGVDILIEAVAKLRKELESYKIIIAGTTGKGEKTYVDSLYKLVNKYQLQNMIEFPGGLYGEDKWNCFRESDLFVLPTLNENFGIVIAESLLSGTPVITCKGAPWAQLETKDCGWWVERNVVSIAQAIKEAISLSPIQLKQMGLNGRRLVESTYSDSVVAKKMKTLYEWILGEIQKPEFVYE